MIQQHDPQQLSLWRGRDRWVQRYQVPSLTDPDRSYVVAIDAARHLDRRQVT